MNSVGIDVSKGKSTVCDKRVGEEVISPFDINHTVSELSELAKLLKSLGGEIRVVSLRPAKTDRKDAEKLADYGLHHWADGTEKWVDFVDKFWHCNCLSDIY